MSPRGYRATTRRRHPMFRQRGRLMAHRRIIVLSAISAVALVLLPIALPEQTTWLWNATASTPIGLYHLQSAHGLYDGELVAAMPPKPIAAYLAQGGFLPLGVPLLKHIAALPGQTICRHGDVITIDGKQVAIALNDDHLGRPLPRWIGCQTLHQGQVFLMNSRVWDSLDGRYFGPFPTATITGHAIPVWLPSTVTAPDHPSGEHAADNQSRAEGSIIRPLKQGVYADGPTSTTFTIAGQPAVVGHSAPEFTQSGAPIATADKSSNYSERNVK